MGGNNCDDVYFIVSEILFSTSTASTPIPNDITTLENKMKTLQQEKIELANETSKLEKEKGKLELEVTAFETEFPGIEYGRCDNAYALQNYDRICTDLTNCNIRLAQCDIQLTALRGELRTLQRSLDLVANVPGGVSLAAIDIDEKDIKSKLRSRSASDFVASKGNPFSGFGLSGHCPHFDPTLVPEDNRPKKLWS